MSTVSLVYCPVGTADEALELGRQLVTERLAACANVVPGVTSIYHWDGALQQDSEVLLLLKTRTDLVSSLRDRLRLLHRYDCPAILSWELATVNAEYLQWVLQETTSEPPPDEQAS
ncbi:MAG: divalent-cation tolerance protein CutA [Planctomycetaceae bacterium]